MSTNIGIIDYGVAGNIHSIKKAVQKSGGIPVIIKQQEDISSVDKLVIPGVGSFYDAMNELESSSLLPALKRAVIDSKIPTLGICLGLQILSKVGFEYAETKGLGFIDAEVRKIEVKGVLPHMGFNSIYICKESKLLDEVSSKDEFYFMHSYEVCNYTDILTLSSYHGHTFVSAIEKNNIFGVQFHPEKSREPGLKIFSNFIHKI